MAPTRSIMFFSAWFIMVLMSIFVSISLPTNFLDVESAVFSPKTNITSRGRKFEELNPNVLIGGAKHDKETVKYLRNTIVPPNGKSLNLWNNSLDDYSQYGQMKIVVDQVLKHKKNGVFIEIGGGDGETYSNTLILEKTYDWTGLLVEGWDTHFNTILTKNRNVHAWYGCVLNTDRRREIKMMLGKVDSNGFMKMNCVPISALLVALNYTKIDFFSLDIEGWEPEVLISFPWTEVQVQVWMIECTGCELVTGRDKQHKRDFLRTFMDVQGYDEVMFLTLDYVYVKREKWGSMGVEAGNGRREQGNGV